MRIMDTIIAYSYKPITTNKVGSWRFVEPYLEDKTPPCKSECPINHSIREIYALIENGKEKDAFFLMAEKNPLLYATGTVCPHFCEQGCNRQAVDESLDISGTESYLGKSFLAENLKQFQKSNELKKKIAVIGAGPSGLSVAYQLALFGGSVDIYEQESEAGGTVRYGIPDGRINKKLLKEEINRLLSSFPQIKIHFNQQINLEKLTELEKNYDQIFLAAGTQDSISSNFNHVQNGFDTLKNYHKGNYKFPENGRYLVLGGGNTAMDVAYYLLENKNKVTVLVRREKSQMKAFAEEIKMVEEKGAQIFALSELKSWDNQTKKALLKLQNKEENWQIDGIFACFGQQEESIWKNIKESKKIKRIGDISGGNATVIHAITDGYKAAFTYLEENGLAIIAQQDQKKNYHQRSN